MNAKLRSFLIGDLSWRRAARLVLLVPPLVLLGFLIVIMTFPDRFIFQPQPSSYRDTSDIIKLDVGGGEKISAKFYDNKSATYTILFSHGNAEDIGTIEPFVVRLRDQGLNVLTYDYRGYGTSDGEPSESNSYSDIEAAYDYLVNDKGIAPEKIILHGRSLGGAVSADLAKRRKVGGLILESTFTSAFRVVTGYRILPFDRFESLNKIGDVHCPLLVIHGTDDRLIPIHHGKELFEAANEPKKALWVEGAGHNDLFYTDREGYLNTIVSFANSLTE